MRLIYYASESHYLDHLVSMWVGHTGGTSDIPLFYVSREVEGYARTIIPDTHLRVWPIPRNRQEVAVVASYQDYLSTRDRPVIFVEHGAGQSYVGVASGSYSGGGGRDRCIAFLVPNATVSQRNLAVYPHIPNHIVGSPRVRYLRSRRTHPGVYDRRNRESGLVGISFHWECGLVPESRSAYEHYKPLLPQVAQRYKLVAHGHPKATHLPHEYAKYGIHYEALWTRLSSQCDVLVIDNSSILYEAAALDIPLVILNAPWYRRDINHGLRFWSDLPGIVVDDPDDLDDAIHNALVNPHLYQSERRQVAAKVYSNDVPATLIAAIMESYE